MVGITELSALMTSIKGAKDLAESMVGLRDAAAFQGKVIEFQNLLMDAQQRVFAAQEERTGLVRRVDELEKKLVVAESWEKERQRYELRDFGGGTFVYALKAGKENGEPSHRICPACYQQGRKSILQSGGDTYGGQEKVTCCSCKTDFMLGNFRAPPDSGLNDDWDPFTGR